MALPYVFPSVETIASASSKLIGKLPDIGVGDDAIQKHLEDDILPALSSSSRSSNYYGFVTGGSTKAASLADNYVTEYDQNVQVHLPRETIATELEDAALRMICDLVGLPEGIWEHRTFTTGATASNVLGLACGREFVLRRHGFNKKTVAEHGLVEAMQAINIRAIQILTTVPHSSLRKAASIVGLGHLSVKDVGRSDAPHRFDLGALTSALSIEGVASIVVVSCAEVNTGAFATSGEDMFAIRKLCSTHTAWLHVDAAFGLQASVLPENDSAYAIIAKGVSGLWMADSITGDAHKLLNVPYDCGIFLSTHLQIGLDVFKNPNAAYLNSRVIPTANGRFLPSPLNIGIENSRRFRALPVYSTLVAYGRQGYRELLMRQIALARAIAKFVLTEPRLELLPEERRAEHNDPLNEIYVVVLFRAHDEDTNTHLVQRINATREIYVSGTIWDDKPAARFAIANWQVDVERDVALIKKVLLSVLSSSP